MDSEEVTEPLANCAEIPIHPSTTTARRIQYVIEVRDATDGTRCTAGLPRSELSVLMNAQRILDHLYKYAILNQKVYHTREAVILVVKCEDADEHEPPNPNSQP